jgi:hypothetical protein
MMSLDSPEYSVSEHTVKATAPVIDVLKRLYYIANSSSEIDSFFVFHQDQSMKLFAFKHLENDTITFFMPRETIYRDRRAEQLYFSIRYGRSYFLQLKGDKLLIPQSLNEFIERTFGTKNRFLEQFIPAIENKGLMSNKKVRAKVIENDDIFFSNIENVHSNLELYFLTEFNDQNLLTAKFNSNEIRRLKEINEELKSFKLSVNPINNDNDFNLPSSKEIAITRYNGFTHLGYQFKGDVDNVSIQLIESSHRVFNNRQSLEKEVMRILSACSQEISNSHKPADKLDKEKFMSLMSELYDIRNNFSKRCQEEVDYEKIEALNKIGEIMRQYQDETII